MPIRAASSSKGLAFQSCRGPQATGCSELTHPGSTWPCVPRRELSSLLDTLDHAHRRSRELSRAIQSGRRRCPSHQRRIPWPRPRVTFVNGGKRRIWAYTTFYHPALVSQPVAIEIKQLRRRRWAYELVAPGGDSSHIKRAQTSSTRMTPQRRVIIAAACPARSGSKGWGGELWKRRARKALAAPGRQWLIGRST